MKRLLLWSTVLLACGDTESTSRRQVHPETARVAAGAPVREALVRFQGEPEPRRVRFSDVDGWAVFEGDIVLGRTESLLRASAARDERSAMGVVHSEVRKRWNGAMVAYAIDPALPTPERVTQAIQHWEARTRLRFVARTEANAALYPAYVLFQPGVGCSAYVGMGAEGPSPIILEDACDVGSTIHEIGHAIGLWHEQSREDRDRHVVIHWDNIEPAQVHNFEQHIDDGDDVQGYDYDSIMHYPPYAFSANGLPTIEALGGQAIGNRSELSAGDIAAASVLYPRPATRPPLAAFTVARSGLTATFVSASTDSDGAIASYLWEFDDGTTSTLASPSKTYASPGLHSARLTVTDDGGAYGVTAWQDFLVGTEAPVAGFTYAIDGMTVAFTDTSTDDGPLVDRYWAFGDGRQARGPTASHTFQIYGTYEVYLAVTDEWGVMGTVTRLVVLEPPGGVLINGRPIAERTAATGGTLDYRIDVPEGATQLVIETAGGTGDADLYVRRSSAPTTSTYDCRPYRTGNTERCEFPTPVPGTYFITLRARQAFAGLTLTASYYELANDPPSADFTFTTHGLSATFTDASADTDGTIVSHSWSFGDGTTSTEANPTVTWTREGTYDVMLVVTDDQGATGYTLRSVTVTANLLPSASFQVTTSGLEARFTDTSTDGDGSIVSRNWAFGDGTKSNVANPSKTYSAAGTYDVTLTVTDDAGASTATTRSVTVTAGNTLQSGIAVVGLYASAGGMLRYTLAVPAGQTTLSFVTSGGVGDADLYVRRGSAPTTSAYDCRSAKGGNAETCTFSSPAAGTYHVLIRAYSSFSGVSLKGTYLAAPKGLFENDTDVAIRDYTTVESAIAVSGRTGNAPSTLQVSVTLVHTYQGDLRVDLVAPNGAALNLWNRSGGGTDNLVRTFTVNASSVPANGTWKLRINDNGPGDTGYLDRWSLQF